MQKELKNMEQLINIVLGMNAKRGDGDAPLQTGVSVPTPFGKMSLHVIDFKFVSADPSLKKLKTLPAKNATLEEVVRQTLGSYRDAYRRSIAVTSLYNGNVNAVKAHNTTIWLLEGQLPAESSPDGQSQKWKVLATVTFQIPGDHEPEIEIS